MAEELAPPVVAVVVTCDPGPWFENCLVALGAQDYANFSTLVVDAGSAEPIAGRVAAVAPDVYIQTLPENRGFGPSANAVLEIVDGAALFLICHDDVTLDPDALRRMVEEAFRSNAGVVAPKLVDPEHPDRLLQLGLGVDRFGAPVRRVEHREFDQAQHDEVREVFAVPGACTLIRADLFATLKGFDPHISMFGEDVDLCWRARLAGARVVVAPAARVRHLEATSSRQRPLPDARALQWRHELRAVLKNYGVLRRGLAVFELIVLSFAEITYFAAIGKRWRVRQVVDAWRWNFASSQDLRGARAEVAAVRRLPDRVVCQLLTARTFRVRRFLSASVEEAVLARRKHRDDPLGLLADSSGRSPRRSRRPRRALPSRPVAGALVLAVLILLVGSRSLLVGHLPLIGQLVPFPSPSKLLASFFGGTNDAGLQGPGPASPALGIVGIVGAVLGGSTSLVLKLGTVLAVVCGALGMVRLVRPLGPPPARLAAAIAYLFLPLAWNDLAAGDVQALVAFGGFPFVIHRLARATGRPPFASTSPTANGLISPEPVLDHLIAGTSRVTGRSASTRLQLDGELLGEVLGLGVLLALLAAFAPASMPLALVCAAAMALASTVVGARHEGARVLGIAAGAALVGFALDFPWSLTFVQPGARWSVLTGAATTPGTAGGFFDLLRLDLGPIGHGLLDYGLLAAGILVLVIGRLDRLAWASRFALLGLGVLVTTWAASRGWLGAGGGDLRLFLAPFAVCVAAAVGLGLASLLTDLPATGFGWRHALTVACAVAGLAGLIPVLGASGGGRFGLPEIGYDTVLSWTTASGPNAAEQKTLWLGDPRALPLVSWQIAPGFAAGVSAGGLPDGTRLWPSANPGAASVLVAAVAQAEAGRTVRLGQLLQREGVRYVVVPTALAPVLAGIQSPPAAPPPSGLVPALEAQLDLHELPAGSGAIVFSNAAWRPGGVGSGAPTSRGATPAALRSLGVAGGLVLWVVAAGYFYVRHRRRRDDEPGGPALGEAVELPAVLVAAGDR